MGKLWFSGCSVMAVCVELWTVLPAESVCSQMEAVLKKKVAQPVCRLLLSVVNNVQYSLQPLTVLLIHFFFILF